MAKKTTNANANNLIPQSQRTKEEARANGIKGGKRSGEVRRAKADLKKSVLAAMEAVVKDPKLKQFANKLGVSSETNLDMIVGVALGKALQGDAKHAENLVKWGGMFNEKLEVETTIIKDSELTISELKERLDDFDND